MNGVYLAFNDVKIEDIQQNSYITRSNRCQLNVIPYIPLLLTVETGAISSPG